MICVWLPSTTRPPPGRSGIGGRHDGYASDEAQLTITAIVNDIQHSAWLYGHPNARYSAEE
jgi:hypothetical protein